MDIHTPHGGTGAGELNTLWHGDRLHPGEDRAATAGSQEARSSRARPWGTGCPQQWVERAWHLGTGWRDGRECGQDRVDLRALPPRPGRWPLRAPKRPSAHLFGETPCPGFPGTEGLWEPELSSEQTGMR